MTDEKKEMPEAGEKAPAFTLESDQGHKVKLTELKGKWVVLYFYPKDDTPGCTIEAKEFRDAQKDYKKANAVILGVSPDSAESHCKFIEKFDLNFELLADTEKKLCLKYGVWVEKSMYGKKYMGVQRATFLISPTGKIEKVWPKVKPAGHAAEVLAAIQEAS